MRFILVSVFQTETKMGTYTTNYNLFMPTVGEQGWGELVNGNFTTIDATMAGLDTRIGTLETETDAVSEKIAKLEDGITVDNGVVMSSGLIDATGGVRGRVYTGKCNITTDSGEILLIDSVDVQSSNVTATSNNSWLQSNTITVNGYENTDLTFPLKIAPNIWVESRDDLLNLNIPTVRTLTFTATCTYSDTSSIVYLYINNAQVTMLDAKNGSTSSYTCTIPVGATCYCNAKKYATGNISISKLPALYVNTL